MREEKARNRVCHECTRTNTSQSSLHFNTSNNKHKQTFWHTRGWEKESLWIPVSQDTSRSSKVFLSGFFSPQRNLSSLAPLIPKGCSVCVCALLSMHVWEHKTEPSSWGKEGQHMLLTQEESHAAMELWYILYGYKFLTKVRDEIELHCVITLQAMCQNQWQPATPSP